jgi:hypothetical protein
MTVGVVVALMVFLAGYEVGNIRQERRYEDRLNDEMMPRIRLLDEQAKKLIELERQCRP